MSSLEETVVLPNQPMRSGDLGALLQHQEWVYDLEATHFRARFMAS